MGNMKVEFNNEDLGEGETIKAQVNPNTEIKSWLVDYVGNKTNPDNSEVTVGLIVETMAKEFPEFLWAVAEENWIRGYQQALQDIEVGESVHRELNLDDEKACEQ
tara:strand:- start:236 stop:550 length:315 start_codon:yes stop_codon:yes gene_type:complete